MDLVSHAVELLRSDPAYLADAKKGAPVGNSIVGSVMSLTTGAPRWATEQAVMAALRQLARRRPRQERCVDE
ncbi:MAG: hypothetical protein JXO72_14935 [Vicinamibacteria bacterium]|nr:hypothetical protein [Vicinamibacteria bacterium]